jgi:glycosyltransferase involved in cell wall biosynthesis
MENNIKPKISVIVPVYNTERYLSSCIDSVINQAYSNIEVILVNDGSTDRSGNICDEYSQFDNRIKVIHQKNSGASTARNKGLDVATGDYIMFLDSDDYWVNSCLEKIVDKLKKNKFDIDVMFLKVAVVKDDNTLTEFKGYEFDYCNREELLDYISHQDKVAVSACLKVIKRDVFSSKQMYFQDSLLAEDIDWFFRLITLTNHFSTYEGEFYCYRILKNSASRNTSEKRIKDYLYILNKWIDIVNDSYGGMEKEKFFYMIGYEYEILLATFLDFNSEIRKKYMRAVKTLFWLLKYRNKPRSRLIKILNSTVGFNNTCRALNLYLHRRSVK